MKGEESFSSHETSSRVSDIYVGRWKEAKKIKVRTKQQIVCRD